ncbi:MAG: DUF4132 domain-containing protein [Bacteroidia bacterium]|nr:DUF4132 domain-containing protein [Bacteroidia bacterium]
MEILKNVLNFFGLEESQESPYAVIIKQSFKEVEDRQYLFSLKATELTAWEEIIKPLSDKEKVAFLFYLCDEIYAYYKLKKRNYNDNPYRRIYILEAYFKQLFRIKISWEDEEVKRLLSIFMSRQYRNWGNLFSWPILSFLNQLLKQYKKTSISKELGEYLIHFRKKIDAYQEYQYEKERVKVLDRIDQVLGNKSDGKPTIVPYYLKGNDPLKDKVNLSIENWPNDLEQSVWFLLLRKTQSASSSKPSARYLKDSKALIEQLGKDSFRNTINEWMEFVLGLKESLRDQVQLTGYSYRPNHFYGFLSPPNAVNLKGLIWMSSHFSDARTLSNLSALGERCYKKVPGVGPIAPALGNACFYSLFKSRGLDGIGRLSRLKMKIKQPSANKIINKYLNQAAKEKGISVHEIEDLAVDNFGLVDGRKEVNFDPFTAVIEITKPGRTDFYWLKEDGKRQKSVPALVKEKYPDKLKKLKQSKKQIEQSTSAQKERIDRMFKVDRKWDMETFRKHFLDHGLMSSIAKKLIWNFEHEGKMTPAIYLEGKWIHPEKGEVKITEKAEVSLWHPALDSVDGIEAWRNFLIEKEIQQPMKQAFREVYLLTDAEINTRTYSNRMATHILKQHQYVNLAKGRMWKAALQGAWDGGYDDYCELPIPEHNLRAQFWVQAVDGHDEFNDSGIWKYMSTDQIRFIKIDTGDVVELVDVPRVLFSEVLRDVDLFVGVASVGNDPTWHDNGGRPQMQTYWQSYSFGDLSEIAKNRKSILKNLVPRLKIKEVAEVGEKFLTVKGKIRTYKIHMGSTNILMEPNDQYLCIVPDRSQKKSVSEKVFIPFEGDQGLSIILSKAFLLAEDDKIKDSTITSQIRR